MEQTSINMSHYFFILQMLGTSFVGSHGQFHKFMVRYSISLWRRTTILHELPGDVDSQIVNIYYESEKSATQNDYPTGYIIAMDEVTLWMGMPANTTLGIRGTHSIPIKIHN